MRSLFCFLLYFAFLVSAEAQSSFEGKEVRKPKTVCLNMIVKNETKVIKQCLASVKNIIDYWVIVDTGSTDGTQEMIKEFMKDIPGELIERPWVDFGHNRSEALSFAKNKADYSLFMDADERLIYSDAFTRLVLEEDYYSITLRGSDPNYASYNRFFLVNNRLPWDWRDVLHEYLVIPPEAKNGGLVNDLFCFTDCNGARSQDPKKYYKDAALLERALEKDPNNSRYVFYLAQSYYNAKEYELAIQNYEKRASMEGEGEVFWGFYAAASLQQFLSKEPDLFIRNYEKAAQKDPTRAEPLFRMAQYYCRAGSHVIGYSLAKLALPLPKPVGGMYIQEWIYDYGILEILGNSALALSKYDEAEQAFQKMLSIESVPENKKNQVREVLSALRLEKKIK